jgi:hypothetical protein
MLASSGICIWYGHALLPAGVEPQRNNFQLAQCQAIDTDMMNTGGVMRLHNMVRHAEIYR